jgi:hypothetical protein
MRGARWVWGVAAGLSGRGRRLRLGGRVKKKTRGSRRIERFADGSSLETLADGSVVLREGGLARASALGSGVGSGAASPAKGISYDDPPPMPRREGGC